MRVLPCIRRHAPMIALALTSCFWLDAVDRRREPLRTTPGALLWLGQHCDTERRAQCWIERFRGPPSPTDWEPPFGVLPVGAPGTVPLLACDYVGHNGRYTQLTVSSDCWGDYGRLLHSWVVGGIVPADRPPPAEMVELHEYALPLPGHGFLYRTGDRDPTNEPPSGGSAFLPSARLGWVVPASD